MKDLLLIGDSGRMGQMIRENLPRGYRILGGVDCQRPEVENPALFDAVLDFSSPAATRRYAPLFIASRIPYICGTTSLDEQDLKFFSELTKHHAAHFRHANNFDPSFGDFLRSVELLKVHFKKAAVEEWHRRGKNDLPSGSARLLAQALGALPHTFSIHRVEGETFRHQVTLISSYRRLRLVHEVSDRRVYMDGILKALSATGLPGFFEGI